NPLNAKLNVGASGVPSSVTCTAGVPVVSSTVAVIVMSGVAPVAPATKPRCNSQRGCVAVPTFTIVAVGWLPGASFSASTVIDIVGSQITHTVSGDKRICANALTKSYTGDVAAH